MLSDWGNNDLATSFCSKPFGSWLSQDTFLIQTSSSKLRVILPCWPLFFPPPLCIRGYVWRHCGLPKQWVAGRQVLLVGWNQRCCSTTWNAQDSPAPQQCSKWQCEVLRLKKLDQASRIGNYNNLGLTVRYRDVYFPTGSILLGIWTDMWMLSTFCSPLGPWHFLFSVSCCFAVCRMEPSAC